MSQTDTAPDLFAPEFIANPYPVYRSRTTTDDQRRLISAEEVKAAGLVHAAYEADEVLERAYAVARS